VILTRQDTVFPCFFNLIILLAQPISILVIKANISANRVAWRALFPGVALIHGQSIATHRAGEFGYNGTVPAAKPALRLNGSTEVMYGDQPAQEAGKRVSQLGYICPAGIFSGVVLDLQADGHGRQLRDFL
jgi:hypothetical protein